MTDDGLFLVFGAALVYLIKCIVGPFKPRESEVIGAVVAGLVIVFFVFNRVK